MISQKTQYKQGLVRLFNRYRTHSKSRNIEFSLSKQQFSILVRRRCYYCGIKPSNKVSFCSGKYNIMYNSLDRLNYKDGYIKGNVVPSCRMCNFMKGRLLPADFIYKCIGIALNRIHKFCTSVDENSLKYRKYCKTVD